MFIQMGDGIETTSMRWGFPTVEEPRATWVTNVRHVMNKLGPSPYWAEWTGPEYRCLVPATSFFERDQRTVGTGAFREVEFRPRRWLSLRVRWHVVPVNGRPRHEEGN